jgi:hypothetical protein
MTDNDPFLKHYSNISTTPGVGYENGNGNNVKVFNTTTPSSNNIISLGTSISRPSVSGLTCTGDLDYPAAKSLSTLFPVVSKHHQQHQTHPCLDDTANRIYIKEVLSSAACTKKSYMTSSSFDNCYMPNNGTTSTGSFDMDSLKILIKKEEKKNKKEKGGNDTDVVVNNNNNNNVVGVHFSNVTIQEYPIQPGDNPGGNNGCPLTIGWEPIGEPVTLQIDLYEHFRSGDNNNNNNRRSSNKLNPLVSAHREHILRQLGHSSKSIRAGTKSANQTRRNRYQTIARLKSSKGDEFLESIQKKVHNIITCGGKKRREKKFLAPYLSASSSKLSKLSNSNNKSLLKSNKDESRTSATSFNDDSVGTNCSIKENNSNNNNNNNMTKSMKSKVVSSQRISAINISP